MAVKRPEIPPVTAEELGLFNPFGSTPPADEPEGPFRVGELSRLSGVSVGTIKFYLREGLVPPGRATAKTQALYDAAHLRRLRLVRILIEVGGLSIAKVREITAVLEQSDDEEPGAFDQAVAYALDRGYQAPAAEDPEPPGEEADPALAAARSATDAFVEELGFEISDGAPAREALAAALAALRTLGIADDPVVFTEHARLAYDLGAFEIASIQPLDDRTEIAEAITVGNVIFGSAFMALRQIAHEHETRRRLGL